MQGKTEKEHGEGLREERRARERKTTQRWSLSIARADAQYRPFDAMLLSRSVRKNEMKVKSGLSNEC